MEWRQREWCTKHQTENKDEICMIRHKYSVAQRIYRFNNILVSSLSGARSASCSQFICACVLNSNNLHTNQCEPKQKRALKHTHSKAKPKLWCSSVAPRNYKVQYVLACHTSTKHRNTRHIFFDELRAVNAYYTYRL